LDIAQSKLSDCDLFVAQTFAVKYVTEFWKITLMGAPEIIRIFEFTTILLTSQKIFKYFTLFLVIQSIYTALEA